MPVQEAPVCLLEFPVRVRKMLVGYKGREDFGSLWMRRCIYRTSQMSRMVPFLEKSRQPTQILATKLPVERGCFGYAP